MPQPDYFMGFARHAATASKDSTKVSKKMSITATNIECREDHWQRQPEWVWYDHETNYVGLGRWSSGGQAAYIRADLVDNYIKLRDTL